MRSAVGSSGCIFNAQADLFLRAGDLEVVGCTRDFVCLVDGFAQDFIAISTRLLFNTRADAHRFCISTVPTRNAT